MDDRLKDFRLHLRRALYVPLLMAVVLAATFLLETYFLGATNRSVQDSYQLINRTRSALKLVLDMETSLRGYLLTGDYGFLAPYNAAQDRVPGVIQQIRRSVGGNREQIARIDQLAEQYDALHQHMQRMIELRQANGDYHSIALNSEGRTLMEAFRGTWDQILGAEEKRLAGRVGAAHDATFFVITSAGILSLLLGVLLSTFTRRELRSVAATYAESVQLAENRAEETESSRRWLATILGSITDGVIATEADGSVSFMNEVARRITGWTLEEAAGIPLSQVLKIVNEVTREPMKDFPAGKGSINPIAYSERLLLLRRDGIEVAINQSSAPLIDENGQTTGMVVVLRDLTEQRRSEAVLRSTDKLASMGRLAASVAHEIHNPLDAIANLLYLLDHSKQLDEASREHVRLASEELNRVTNISEQMLTFSRESRVPVPVKIRDLLDNVLVLYQARLHASEVRLEKRYEDVLEVRAFPGELRQVFSNLIGNALDAMGPTGILTIHVRPSCDWYNMGRRGVRVTIADTGAGISEADRQHISEAFYTTKGEKGTGLGLWVSAGIVQKYGGLLRFRSRTGEHHGTVFQVFLPVGSAVAVPSSPAAKGPESTSRQQAS
ncbi:MAG TPA: CHASE3 domain-containing protein [Terriglobales bacterium]|nr:CHASE3 domain-containing protein [Terriglobales bacterium]